MSNDIVTKTVFQYSKELPAEIINSLKEIASDYNKVKNYVYGRYSGVNSLNKLTPGYTVMNEMRYCGLRQQLNLPVVYYELAILDALRDIKSVWSNLKNKIAELVKKNENLTKDDRVYLLTVLKFNSVFNSILMRTEFKLPKNAENLQINLKRLDNLLCRYVRKYKQLPKGKKTLSFTVSPMGYKYYEKGTIGFVSRIPRQRIKVELRDKDIHSRQLRVFVKENYIAIAAPVDVKIKKHSDYINNIYVHIGFLSMFALSNGRTYGNEFNKLVNAETDRLKHKNIERHKIYKVYVDTLGKDIKNKLKKIKYNNMGKKKYIMQKKARYAEITTFINSEINKMIEEEKPCIIVICKAINNKKKMKKIARHSREKLTRSFEGYIRKRLKQKCDANGIKIVEVNPVNISIVCSRCGKIGKKQNTDFICEDCGFRINSSINSAINIKKRYLKLD